MEIHIANPFTTVKGLNRSEIDDFRNETLNFLIPFLCVLSFSWGMMRGYRPVFGFLWPPFAIFLIGVTAAFFRRLKPRPLSFLISTGISCVFLAAAYLWNKPELAYFCLPVISFACLLLDLPGSLAFMFLVTLAMSAFRYATAGAGWLAFLGYGPLLAAWLTWLVARLGLLPYLASLKAARKDRAWALAQYDSGKGYQSELRQALKQLESANYLICKQNHSLEQARFEAEQARKAKNEFAAMVSHELLTPINLIAGYSEMICKSPRAYGGQPLPSTYRADVWAIFHSAQHLRSLISDVLDLSRLDTGKITLYKEIVSPGELLKQVVEIAHDLVTQKGLRLEVDIPQNSGLVLVDVKRIRQVWLNLIRNAVRFTEQGAIRLCIRQDADRGEIVHSVQDTGIGIQAGDLQRLFQPFEQLSNPLNRTHEGSGLGLALCKSFVEEHEGKIWAESQNGHGTRFTFTLAEFHPPSPET